MDMKKWIAELKEKNNKGTMPILTFPAVQHLDVSVEELIKKGFNIRPTCAYH